MSDWQTLTLSIENNGLNHKQIHQLICKALTDENKVWIAEVDLDVQYKVFDSVQQMCQFIWCDWPGDQLDDFIKEHKILKVAPVIFAKHARQYYVLKSKEFAEQFMEISKQVITNNPHDENEDDDDEDEAEVTF